MKNNFYIRLSKISLLFIIAANLSIVAVDNLLDYTSNYLFVQNVMTMDTTFPDNKLKWRAITSPFMWNVSYVGIILWEFSVAIFCWIGVYKLIKAIKTNDDTFNQSKTSATIGLTLCLLLFGFAFITVAGEWFLMWQSTTWNGESAAIRLFSMAGIAVIYLNMKD